MVSFNRFRPDINSNKCCSAYPIEYIENTKIPCISDGHPTNIILLTCDARGVLPPISKLTTEQTMFHFISGYTSKMAGTEQGITEPQATFSTCFAQPFLALHPMRYAKMLAEKMAAHKTNAWLLNTGWVGAGATTGGKRCPLKYTRAILDAIHSGELAQSEYETYETFNLQVPTSCPGVPDELLNPAKSWTGTADFKGEVNKLGVLFNENFKKYADEATAEVIAAGPQTTESVKPAAEVAPHSNGTVPEVKVAESTETKAPEHTSIKEKLAEALHINGSTPASS
jgi:phosphoenolpyruvate carboxykinase (ATP)